MSEDLPSPESRVTVDGDRIILHCAFQLEGASDAGR